MRTNSRQVVESTNAMLSLLTEVCDPVFLMFRLQTALHRFLAAHTAEGESQKTSQLHTSGYAYVLNAMGMCILKLPKEAVEHEAKRLSKWVIQVGSTHRAGMLTIVPKYRPWRVFTPGRQSRHLGSAVYAQG